MQLLLHQTHSEEDDVLPEEEMEVEDDDAGTAMILPVLETELGSQDFEQALVNRQEEFAEFDRGNEIVEEELNDKKVGENMYVEKIFSAPVLPNNFPVHLILCVDYSDSSEL